MGFWCSSVCMIRWLRDLTISFGVDFVSVRHHQGGTPLYPRTNNNRNLLLTLK